MPRASAAISSSSPRRRSCRRALKNRFTDAWHGRERELEQGLSPEKDRYAAAAQSRDFDTAVIFAGEAVNLIDSVLPAREIVRRICG